MIQCVGLPSNTLCHAEALEIVRLVLLSRTRSNADLELCMLDFEPHPWIQRVTSLERTIENSKDP